MNIDTTQDEPRRDDAWIIAAEWSNSGRTFHGPFTYAEQAEQWARQHLDPDAACTGYELAILSPVQPNEAQ